MLRDFLYSIFIGAGAIAPGLSGGTLAIILGMYERMIEAVGNLLRTPARSIRILMPIGAGALVGIVAFSTVQKYLLGNYLMQTMFCFMGLIIGSLPFLAREANQLDPITRRNAISRIVPFTITLVLGVVLAILDTRAIDVTPMVVAMSPLVFARLLIVGVLIAASLIIPGLSGTVLLVMIGQYGLVLNAVSDIKNILKLPMASPAMIQGIIANILVLLPLALGTVVGGLLFSIILNHLFRRWHGQAYAGILGFVVGSIPALYPAGADFGLNGATLASLALLVGGTLFAYWFSTLERHKSQNRSAAANGRD